jgi:GNAT superfamily N-acetyltransferase
VKAVTASKIVLESIGVRDRPESLIRELYAAAGPLYAEAAPDEPRQPLEQALAFARSLPEAYDGATIVARDRAGRIVGSADVTVQDMDGFRHVAQVSIGVLPAHRRAGVGRALLDGAVEVAGRIGRSLLMGDTRETVPAGEAFARRIGAGLGQVMLENRLDLRTVDRDLVRSWVEAGPARAPGYHLEFVRGSTPDGLMPGVVAMLEMVINTAPRDELQIGDRAVTPERLKQEEQAAAAAGLERWAYYAVDNATGDFVGLTDVVVSSAAPERVQVGNTAVEPAHRGRALGKWLKGAMTQKVLDELPAAHWLVTSNAASNDAMLSINRQLGFHASAAVTTWQVSTERARAYLSGQA